MAPKRALDALAAGMRHPALVFALVALLAALPYGVAAARTYRTGFPLDDAWIYQAIARTWVETGTWGVRPGVPAAGATAPLWVLPLALGQRLVPGSPLLWAWALGLGLLATLGLSAFQRSRALGLTLPRAFLVGLLVLSEWHLVWAALSGMETLAFALVAWWVLGMLERPRPSWAAIGWGVGLGVWLRPEALLLLLPWAWRVWRLPQARERGRALYLTGFPLFVLLTLYPLFQLMATGRPWPNTAEAKMAEYASLRLAPLVVRWLRVAWPPLVGLGLFLLPGVVLALRRFPQARGALLWVAAHVTLYAWRLPVTYQHGRYIIPVLPVLLWWGLMGYWASATASPDPYPWRARWRRFRDLLLPALALGFWLLGARVFAQDVAVIESEMVDTARWVARHLPADEPLAAHDIGALGYFAPQPLVDLAGLLNPEVVPFIRNELRLVAYLQEKGIRYLVIFPNWYGHLVTYCAAPLYRSQAPFAPNLGGENQVVYRWQACPPGHY